MTSTLPPATEHEPKTVLARVFVRQFLRGFRARRPIRLRSAAAGPVAAANDYTDLNYLVARPGAVSTARDLAIRFALMTGRVLGAS